MCVCLSVCLQQHSEVISEPISKCDMTTDAYSQLKGVFENRFKIEVRVKKSFRKNLITQVFLDCFESLTHGSTRLEIAHIPVYVSEQIKKVILIKTSLKILKMLMSVCQLF